jgi:lysophospholipase L1-like esterase
LSFFQRLRIVTRAKVFRQSSGDSGAVAAPLVFSGEAPKRILIFGDSNAFRPGDSDTCWPALLESKDPIHLNVFNESSDGRTTRYGIGEQNGLGVIGSKLAAHAPLNYVIVMLGTNDVKRQYGPPSAAEIAHGMSQILDLIGAQGNDTKPVILTPPPLGHITSGDLAGAQSRISRVAAKYRSLARKRGLYLVDLNVLLDSSTDLMPDKTHLNAVGRQKVADAIWTGLSTDSLQNAGGTLVAIARSP